MQLSILSVNVGLPRYLGLDQGETIDSGIRKAPVTGPTLLLGEINLEGDGQADREQHGGPDKAVYAYPQANWAFWAESHGLSCGPGAFGENLTLGGGDEASVRIGDVFSWGDALLEVSQPRQPCFKLGMHLGRPEISALMMRNGRCGWYYRVRRGAVVPVEGALVCLDSNPAAPTVRDLFIATFGPKSPPDEMFALADTLRLAPAWQETLTARARAKARAAAKHKS